MAFFNHIDDLLDPFSFCPPAAAAASSICYLESSSSNLWPPPPPLLFPTSAASALAAIEDDLPLDLLRPCPFLRSSCLAARDLPLASPLNLFDASADLLALSDRCPAIASLRSHQDRAETERHLRQLNDRVAALELGLGAPQRCQGRRLDRKYTWTAEIGGDRRYKWTAEAKGSGEKGVKWTAEIKDGNEEGFDRKYKWIAETKGPSHPGDGSVKWLTEIKGKGALAPLSRKYTWQSSTKPRFDEEEEHEKKTEKKKDKKKEEKKKNGCPVHLIEIEETNPGAVAIRKAFAKISNKGKRKELSPLDAALLIQATYRAHLARRSQVLRCLRDLAVAKARLKELRALFANFNYRGRIVKDAEERQRFSERIIVLLLTVEAIEGPDYMVRAAKKSMIEELELMLDVVDPQPANKLASMKRRKFDLPEGGEISKAMMAGVADVVQMLDDHE